MRLLTGSWLAPLGFALVAACSHSDPTGSWFPPTDGPLNDVTPARLTFSPGTDVWPLFSQDGSRLLYTFELGSPDHDRCLGVLPGIGGQRVAEVCASTPNQVLSRDGFEHGNLSERGLLAYTKHSGNIGGPTATVAALYVAPIDSLAGERKVFDLLEVVPGASRIWDYLLNPIWISDNELAFIGTQVDYIPPGPFLDPDTIYVGLDLAKVRIDGATTVVTVLADLGNAQTLAYDPTLSRFAFLRNDSVFTIGASGGAATFYFATSEVEDRTTFPITGLAAGGGKIWISWGFRDRIPINFSRTRSLISEVTSSGGLIDLHVRDRITADTVVYRDDGRWARLAASPNGRRLAAEGQGGPTGASSDIYLFELP